jgi:hypothetical protein
MANTWKDLSDGDIVRECLDSFHNKQTFLKTIDRQYDNRFAKDGSKNGGELLIRNPNWFTYRSGAAINVQDVEESTQKLTVANEYGVDVNWSSVDETLSVEAFKERILNPMMATLAGNVEYLMMVDFLNHIHNITGVYSTTPATLLAISNARARLADNLVKDEENCHILLAPTQMAAVTGAMATYFHKASEIERAFSKGYMGEAAGFKWWETASLPSHINGTRDDTSITAAVNAWANGQTTITIVGASGTFTEGDVFTVATVYACNPETKQPYDYLQQFVVRAAITNGGTSDVVSISPTIYVSGPKQNVYAPTAGATDAVVNLTAGGSGAAGATVRNGLAYHRDAFAAVFTNLIMPYSGQAARATSDGISMRIWKDSDIKNDTHTMRVDILCGWITKRPEWATRVRNSA